MAAEEATTLLARALELGILPKHLCGVERAKQERPDLSAQIDELNVHQPRIAFSVQSRVLKEIGLDVKADTLSRHVRGLCSCRGS